MTFVPQAGRHVAYYTFGDPALVREGAELWGALREGGVTVGHLYRCGAARPGA